MVSEHLEGKRSCGFKSCFKSHLFYPQMSLKQHVFCLRGVWDDWLSMIYVLASSLSFE